MNKKVIGIDINEVLRARSMQFDRYYAMEFDGEGLPPEDDPYKFDLRNDYKWEDGYEVTQILRDDLPDDISPLDYQVDEKTGKAPVDAIAFKEEKEFVTADEKFKRFIYQDYLLEIHGLAPMLYKRQDRDVEKFYYKYKDSCEFKIVSKENWFTIPPTLYFLGKNMIRIKSYSFVETNEEIWDGIDILITTDPELLENIPKGKTAIKLNRPYNQDVKNDFEDILQLKELSNNKDFQELIGYKEPIKEEEIKKESENE